MKAKLKSLPIGAPLRINNRDATFGHLDGMYSLCWFDDDRATFHLSRLTPLVLVDGRWELDLPPDAQGR